MPIAIRSTPIHPEGDSRSFNQKDPTNVPTTTLTPTTVGILLDAGTPIPEIINDSISAAPTARPAAIDQTTPSFKILEPFPIPDAAAAAAAAEAEAVAPETVVPFIVSRFFHTYKDAPIVAATNWRRTPPKIGSMGAVLDDEAFMMNRLYRAYAVAHTEAGRIQPALVVGIEEDEDEPPRASVEITDIVLLFVRLMPFATLCNNVLPFEPVGWLASKAGCRWLSMCGKVRIGFCLQTLRFLFPKRKDLMTVDGQSKASTSDIPVLYEQHSMTSCTMNFNILALHL
jgi:hypothetical protein